MFSSKSPAATEKPKSAPKAKPRLLPPCASPPLVWRPAATGHARTLIEAFSFPSFGAKAAPPSPPPPPPPPPPWRRRQSLSRRSRLRRRRRPRQRRRRRRPRRRPGLRRPLRPFRGAAAPSRRTRSPAARAQAGGRAQAGLSAVRWFQAPDVPQPQAAPPRQARHRPCSAARRLHALADGRRRRRRRNRTSRTLVRCLPSAPSAATC